MIRPALDTPDRLAEASNQGKGAPISSSLCPIASCAMSPSSPPKGDRKQLSAKQLSSIVGSLSQASERRESDLRRRLSREPTPASLVDLDSSASTTSGTSPKTPPGNLAMMLEAGLQLVAPTLDMDNPKELLAELDSIAAGSSALSSSATTKGDDDLDQLRANITDMLKLKEDTSDPARLLADFSEMSGSFTAMSLITESKKMAS